MARHRDRSWVRVIAVGKFVKVALLIAGAVLLLAGVDHDLGGTLARWAEHLHVDPRNRHLHAALVRLTGMSDDKKELFAVAGFAYAALFLTEGIGLWLDARWAEWLTVIATTSFIPMEIYELVRDVTVARVILLAANVLVVIYLIVRLRKR